MLAKEEKFPMIDVAEALVPDWDAAEFCSACIELHLDDWMNDKEWIRPCDWEGRALR